VSGIWGWVRGQVDTANQDAREWRAGADAEQERPTDTADCDDTDEW
jgi:hypothetical protein